MYGIQRRGLRTRKIQIKGHMCQQGQGLRRVHNHNKARQASKLELYREAHVHACCNWRRATTTTTTATATTVATTATTTVTTELSLAICLV